MMKHTKSSLSFLFAVMIVAVTALAGLGVYAWSKFEPAPSGKTPMMTVEREMGDVDVWAGLSAPTRHLTPKQIAARERQSAQAFAAFQARERHELACLAKNIYYEARGEPIEGQYAVAEVTIARTQERGTSICAEVYRHAQFSWTLTEQRAPHGDAWRVAQRIAEYVRHAEHDGLCCTHFHANYVRPSWAKAFTHVMTIGKHHFYRRDA
jgi:spore germination cell wall hydrolase CwlJ-like protein